jgi:nickel/cobalt exporter
MRSHRAAKVGCGTLAGLILFALLGAPVASAHPLGNFSINHSHNFEFTATTIVDRAVVDFAEIPTAQSEPDVDTDGDGELSPAEFDARGVSGCADLVQRLTMTVGGAAVRLTVASSAFTYEPGQAGLPTGRLECRFEAPASFDHQQSVSFSDDFAADRVGWHEINAVGDGVQLIDSPVPTTSGTEELRDYPLDLLGNPMNVHELTVAVAPGTVAVAPSSDSSVAPISPDSTPSLFEGGPFAGVVRRVTSHFNDLVGRRDLTVGVGLLAVALAMVLGASHALLPGHGKTVMAAYIAGRQGSSRDAVIVGATVTATHTGGVLLLGLALTLSSSLAGETVLGWLGVGSGTMIAVLGCGLVWGALHHRAPVHGHTHRVGSRHSHAHGSHDHDHDHGDHTHDDHGVTARPVLHRAVVEQTRTGRRPIDRRVTVSPMARTSISRAGVAGHDVAVLTRPVAPTRTATTVRRSTASPAPVAHTTTTVSRRGLIGMGVAGGLVPSPSALIVLLSAIALGRTAFGIVLVIGYGLGMAATLTLAGLLLVRVRDRYQNRLGAGDGRLSAAGRHWRRISPYATAGLVVVVGLGIAIRGAGSL